MYEVIMRGDPLFQEGVDYHEKERYRFERAFEATGRPTGKKVFDIGSFPGTAWHVFGSQNQYISFGLVAFPEYRAALVASNIEHIDADIETCSTPIDADVVLFMEIVEHLRMPYAALKNLAAMTKPGATVYITTNNASYYGYIMKLLLNRNILDSIDTESTVYPGHTRYFGLEELAAELSKVGFTVKSKRYINLLPRAKYYRSKLFAAVKNSIGALVPARYSTHIEIVAVRNHANVGTNRSG